MAVLDAGGVGVEGVIPLMAAADAPPITGAVLASPKSSSFAPPGVSITLPGFKSRCRMPARCAVARALGICMPNSSAGFSGNGLCGNGPRASRLPDIPSPGKPCFLRANVVEVADGRMIKGRDCPGFPFEAGFQLIAGRKMCRKNLDRDRAFQAGIASAVDFAHPAPSPDWIS